MVSVSPSYLNLPHLVLRVHFIPLSLGYHELYNIYTYFSGIPDAALTAVNERLPRNLTRMNEDDALEKIGEAGARWKRSIGRYVDMEGERFSCILISHTDHTLFSICLSSRPRICPLVV